MYYRMNNRTNREKDRLKTTIANLLAGGGGDGHTATNITINAHFFAHFIQL